MAIWGQADNNTPISWYYADETGLHKHNKDLQMEIPTLCGSKQSMVRELSRSDNMHKRAHIEDIMCCACTAYTPLFHHLLYNKNSKQQKHRQNALRHHPQNKQHKCDDAAVSNLA